MSIATITISYNDGYQLDNWHSHYLDYKDEITLHIIVDNNSSEEFYQNMKKRFVDSVIIRRDSNGGCTGAYNDGIRYALKQNNIDHIALVGKDIKLSSGSLTTLSKVLFENPNLGMVEPILFERDSTTINDFGCSIDKHLFMKSYMAGKNISDIKEDINFADAVTGGMNMATRFFYEKVGLQDELLFMYSDEVDMGIRAKKMGFKMAAISSAKAWHQHIDSNKKANRRHPFSRYLIARNKTYLARKHYGARKCLNVALFFIIKAMVSILILFIKGNFSKIKDEWWQILGAINGFNGNMKQNKYSHQ